MRVASLVSTLCLLSQSALAAPPKKGIGDAKEEDPRVCATAPSVGGADLALLRGLSWAFEPAPIEVRVQAIEDLGFLGDARALNPLAQLCLDPNPALARAAIRAIALIRHPRSEEILSNVIRHPSVPDATKARALELLPYQNSWSSLRFIRLTAQQTAAMTSVVMLARRMAAELPQRPQPPPAELNHGPKDSFEAAPWPPAAPPPSDPPPSDPPPAPAPATGVPMVPGDSK